MSTSRIGRVPQKRVIVKSTGAIYARISSQGQKEGTGIDRQITNGRKALAELGVTVPNHLVFPEVVSASKVGFLDRPEFRKVLEAAQRGQFDHLYVDEASRLSRSEDVIEAGLIVSEFRRYGVKVIIPGVPDASTPEGQLFITIQNYVATKENALRSMRVRGARERLLADGKWPAGHAPYGYLYDKPTKSLKVHDGEAAIVKQIFNLYTKRAIGTKRIAYDLNEMNLGRRFTGRFINRVLRNPVYRGDAVNGAKAPAIVDAAQWRETQRRLGTNRHLHPPRKDPWILQGKMRCGYDGYLLRTEYSHGRRFYICQGRRAEAFKDGPRCTLRRFRAEELEELIVSHAWAQLSDPEKAQKMADNAIAQLRGQIEAMEQNLRPVREQLDGVNKRLEDLGWAVVNGLISRDAATNEKRELENERDRLEAQASELDPDQLDQLERTRKQLTVWQESLKYTYGAPYEDIPEETPKQREKREALFAPPQPGEEVVTDEWGQQWVARGGGWTRVSPLAKELEEAVEAVELVDMNPELTQRTEYQIAMTLLERTQAKATVYNDHISLTGLVDLGDIDLEGAQEGHSVGAPTPLEALPFRIEIPLEAVAA